MATLTRSFDDSVYRPGVPVNVTLHIVPDVGTLAYALEETPPSGWVISDVSNGGNIVEGKIKYGLFFDSTMRDFTYRAIPPLNSFADVQFQGVASFDGVSSPVGGVTNFSFDDIAPSSPQ